MPLHRAEEPAQYQAGELAGDPGDLVDAQMSGNAIKMIDPLIVAISVPSVVLDRAIHR